MNLDVRTMYIAMAATCFIVAFGLFIFQAGRFRRDGTLSWIFGWAFQGAFWVLLGLRGLVWDFFSIVVAHTFLAAGFSFLYAAVREFQGRRNSRGVLLLLPAVTFGFFWFFSGYTDKLFYRIIFISLLSILQSGAIAWLLFHGAPIDQRRSYWLTGFCFIVYALVFMNRFLEAFTLPYAQLPILIATTLRNASVGASFGVAILSTVGFVLMIRDRTDHALRQAEERARLALRAGKMGTWDRILPDGEVIWNEERYRMLGYEPGTAKPSYEAFAVRVHPDDLAEVAKRYQRSLHQGGEFTSEFRVVWPDGTSRWTEVRGQTDRDASGRATRSYGIMIDITERKKMEEALRRSRDELEIRVKERTAKLQESEVRLRVLASELINAQETERKRIAHELHDSLAAQLAAIKYRLERKRKGGESPDNPGTLDEIIEDVHNANVETRRIMANLRPSVLDDLGILPALSWFSRETEKTYPGTLIECLTDIEEREVPEELKIVLFRVVQESVTNAIRHGKSNRIQIRLEKNHPWLRLRVDDNGKGFNSVKLGEKSENGGIGLDSMQQRVDSTGGIFSLTSTPGKGTTVKAEWGIG